MRKRNPSLVIYGNPRPVLLSREVHEVKYHHAEDGEDYVHGFRSKVCMELVTARRHGKLCREIVLYGQQGQPLWGTTDEIADGQFDGGKVC